MRPDLDRQEYSPLAGLVSTHLTPLLAKVRHTKDGNLPRLDCFHAVKMGNEIATCWTKYEVDDTVARAGIGCRHLMREKIVSLIAPLSTLL